MKNLKTLLIATVCALVFVSHTAAEEWKKIRIATEGAYPPWNYTDKSGKLIGFDIDLIGDLCRRMKAECKIVPQKWRGIIKGLNAGKYDAIMAAMSITEERKKRVLFTRSYADTPNIFVIRKDHPLAEFRSELKALTLNDISPAEQAVLDSLTKALTGKTVGVQVATINQRFADKFLGDHSDIRIYDFQHTIDLELYQGRLDALIGGAAYWGPIFKSEQGREYTRMGPYMTGGPFGEGIGTAVRKKDKTLANLFSTAIKQAIDDGTLKKMAVKWFGVDISAPEKTEGD